MEWGSVSTAYADLARTASGALTAESKRIVAREQAEEHANYLARVKRDMEAREAWAALEEATHAYDVFAPDDTKPGTEREQRIVEHAETVARKRARDDYAEEQEGTVVNAIERELHRIQVLGINDRSTAEILEALRTEIAA